ncbi:transketolase [Campylobacter jejuni]|uniref:Transketolase n=2 Tax=Campylobacter jejuni TaxID=197 RepID=A0A5T0DBF1_CAMJU|nr:transketolase [Campylobacter jejuni]ALN44046.1 Transketolase, N-terminal section [Campylobacter jejuni subsp. jejuni]EAI3784753.1 transketolase [Campylobacter jejuni]EAI4463256.1 transketolase [Campylobacter jejuni]EAI4482513.1 transketolase [Campylobacter jejuni]EAI4485371.1 transketolase [Campylobacter jejuni]
MINFIKEKVKFVKIETLKLHKIEPIVRIASSMSCVEIFTILYYGKLIKYNPSQPLDDNRDRIIVSKAHGSICLYPILADLGFFSFQNLMTIGQKNSFLGTIPEPTIPGYETINGSLGHGLGLACGSAMALQKLNKKNKVVVVCGDGELNEGSVWEAIMFAGHHKLNNLLLIIDFNKASMLGFVRDIIDLNPIKDKFKVFNWEVFEIKNGHNIKESYKVLEEAINFNAEKPKVVISHTIKGNGIKNLENNPLSHVLSINPDDIDGIIEEILNEY